MNLAEEIIKQQIEKNSGNIILRKSKVTKEYTKSELLMKKHYGTKKEKIEARKALNRTKRKNNTYRE